MRRSVFLLTLLSCCLASAELAKVTQQEAYGTQTTVRSEGTYDTATLGTTVSPNAHSGYIFTGWTLYPVSTNTFTSVDSLGRALERAQFMIYEDVVLTANYLPETTDTDEDGLPDGSELYWFGDLSHDETTDADGDGRKDIDELLAGTNPLVANSYVAGGVDSLGVSDQVDYNPYDLHYYTVKCEPEGKLFNTYSNLVESGTTVKSPSVSSDRGFAYWKLNGVRQADASGRALDNVSFATSGDSEELVAVCETDETNRALLYWFGTTEIAADQDTDGDGVTDFVEIEADTNPLFADSFVAGGVESLGTSAQIGYNPYNMQYYTVKCNPEGKLFNTYSNLVEEGTVVNSPSVRSDSVFAYWTLNGVRQADAYGRALTSVTFRTAGADELVAVCENDATSRALLQWFGTTDVSDTSDVDEDGIADLEEIEAGTNPLFANAYTAGGVVSLGVSDPEWANLQIYERMDTFVVAKESESLSRENVGVIPYLCDLDGDGLFDMVLKYADDTVLVLHNSGSAAHPAFEVVESPDLTEFDWNQNDLSKLEGHTFDVPMEDGLSACYGLSNDLLVSDIHGRIWYYTANDDTLSSYTLQHRIWGGTYYGFAEGLHIATVDWDDDGDLDCLCGTSDGQLFLLRNPDVGHPTGASADDGKDSVILVWDPVSKSCIRGYRVYRDGERIAEVALPNYRDENLKAGTYTYQVSSVSRFYKAGSSTPIEQESPLSAECSSIVGQVTFALSCQEREDEHAVEITVTLNNSLNYEVAGKVFSLTFDATKLRPADFERSGLTHGVVFDEQVGNGTWKVTGLRGTVQPGQGAFLRFRFDRIPGASFESTDVNLTADGESLSCTVEGSTAGRVHLGDVDGNGRLEKADLQLLAQLMNGHNNWTAAQLRAGDFNGNGRLDTGDYILAKAYFRIIQVVR